MRTRFFAIAGAAALTIAGFAAGSFIDHAEAQSAQKAPVILTVSLAQLVSQSKAGKTLPPQLEQVQKNVQKELDAEVEKLNKDIDDFKKNSSLMSEEVRQQKQKELAMRQQYGLPQQAQIMDQALKIAAQNAQAKVLRASEPIIKDIVDKRGATIVLDKATVMYAAADTDITQEVLAGLDKKLSSVEVEKITLADVMKKLKDAQQAQQAQQADASKNKKK